MSRLPSPTPAPGPRGVTLPLRVPVEWAIDNGYASRLPNGAPGIACSLGLDDDRVIFHYLTGRPAPDNFEAGSAAEAQWTYRSGAASDRSARISRLAR